MPWWLAVLALTLFSTFPLAAQTVASYSFEDGKADGWGSFYYASTPVATTADAYAGSYSLLTTTGSGNTGGPSISLTGILQPGAKYTITGYVKLTSGETATNSNFTIARTDPSCSGGTCYDTIGAYQVPVSDSGWAQIGGSYTVSATTTATLLYSQLVGPTTAQSFYLDDVVVTQTAPPPGGTAVLSYNFSDGGLDGWFPFGSPTLTNAVPPVLDPNSDARALLVSNRTATYMGPAIDLLGTGALKAGATYQVTAYVLLASADANGPTVTVSTKSTDCANTSGAYTSLGTSAALSTGTWAKVQGTFSFSNQPGPPTSLVLYLQSSSATDSFYIGDVTIGELAPPPIDPSQQDNSGITSTFEDGGLDGWSSRAGATLTNSTATAHTGNDSLLVTGRTANYDGAQIGVSNKMYVGSLYNVSAWVKLLPTDNSTHIINLSLQTTVSGNTSYNSVSGYPGVSVPADGNWHQISVMNYSMANPYDQGQAYLYLQTVPPTGNDLVSFYVDDFQLTYIAPPSIQTNIPSIYQSLSADFPIGAAVDLSNITGVEEQLLTKHFNGLTPGNDMKWSSVESTLGTYTYTNADQIVGVATCNNMKVRGHNLVWATGAQTPAYATGDGTNSPANQALVTSNIQEHIQNEVQHFGNKVYAWDVVNEPLDPSQPDCLVHGPFYQVLGKSYIDIALQAARKYAPAGTKLFINDYNTQDPARLACLVRVVHDLRDRGIPLDAVGHETHNAINYPTVQSLVNAVDTMADHFPGLEQQITEFDVSIYPGGDNTSNYGTDVPPAIIAEQGWLYKQTFDAFRSLKGKLSEVTIWGMADNDTWLSSFPIVRTNLPLPFDTNLQAKPAYWGIIDPTQLPGAGLTFTSTNTPAANNHVIVTITATNGDVGTAYDTELHALQLRQTSGAPCTPWMSVPGGSLPVKLGDIAANGTASATFNINFGTCAADTHFTLKVPWSSATYDTGIFVTSPQ
jgi:endo-1,4-beta-xylanase